MSGGTINVGTTGNNRFDGTFTNSNLFANNLNFNLTRSSGVSGGIFYAVNNTTIDTQGSLNFGTIANPILLLAGNNQLSVPGNLTVNGMVYTNATTISTRLYNFLNVSPCKIRKMVFIFANTSVLP
jgi:hypothetical protein